MKIYSSSLRGRRKKNEDTHHYIETKNKIYLGVYDGHGGSLVSKYLKANFIKNIQNKDDNNSIDYVVDHIQDNLAKRYPSAKECGSTLLVGIIDKNTKDIRVINIGDSRAVMAVQRGGSIEARALSKDHKPFDPPEFSEKNRIEGLNEKLEWDSDDSIYRVNGFAVSRAMGDLNYRAIGHRPDFRKKNLANSPHFILACDGLWDVMNNTQAVNFIDNYIKKNPNGDPANAIAKQAIINGSYDNVTVIVGVNN
uniref:Protein phosphatase 2C n=1 Tax=Megaviridae environmental sample TaxID=1737588 RepID=A0A5J6VJ48_9VIRU|nr:MAG: protein phosphatase 2C [Megaviridae environmental sample]